MRALMSDRKALGDDGVLVTSEKGLGDDILCEKCCGYLDTGLECVDCEHDNWFAVTGKVYKPTI